MKALLAVTIFGLILSFLTTLMVLNQLKDERGFFLCCLGIFLGTGTMFFTALASVLIGLLKNMSVWILWSACSDDRPIILALYSTEQKGLNAIKAKINDSWEEISENEWQNGTETMWLVENQIQPTKE